MRIAKLEAWTVRVPYRREETSSLIRRGGITEVIVKLTTDDGHVGWGECTRAADTRGVASAIEAMRPLVEGCGCPCCTHYDRAYLRHLFVSEEMLGLRLLALHNVTFLLDVTRHAREALRAGVFASWSESWLARYRAKGKGPSGE